LTHVGISIIQNGDKAYGLLLFINKPTASSLFTHYSQTEIRSSILDKLNEERKRLGKGKLTLNPMLSEL
jgi:hypothetical protein